MPEPRVGLPSDLLLNQPDVLAAEHQLKATPANTGAAAFLGVLDAEREQRTSEQQRVQKRRALLSNELELYAGLGGGWLTLSGPAASTETKLAKSCASAKGSP